MAEPPKPDPPAPPPVSPLPVVGPLLQRLRIPRLAPFLVLAALIGVPAGVLAFEQLHLSAAGVAAPASGTRTFEIEAYQWGYSPANITVHRGDRVRLLLTSRDVIHGFQIPAYHVDAELYPGRWTEVDFVADKAGTFETRCDIFCASLLDLANHFKMMGKLVVEG